MGENIEGSMPNPIVARKPRFKRRMLHHLAGRSSDRYGVPEDRESRSLRFNTRKDVRADLGRFLSLSILDEDAKRRLRPVVKHHLFLATWSKFQLLERAHIYVMSFAFAFIPLAFILTWLLPATFGPLMVAGPSTLLMTVDLGWTYAFMALSRLSWKGLSETKHRFWWVGPFFYFAAAYIDPGYPYHPKTAFGEASAGVAVVLSIAAGAWTAVHALVNISRETQKHRLSLRPDSYIVTSYLSILYFLDDHPTCLKRAADKRHLLVLLEQVASVMQRDLPKPFHTNSSDADVWFRGRSAQMATAVRNLKTWVLAPKPDTLEHFTARIVADMSSVATGDWDALPTDDTKPVQEKTILMRGSMLLLRGIILGIFMLLATHSTKLEPHWVSGNYTFLLVAFPLLVTLSERIDPVISPVISSYKETLKSVQEIGKKSEH